MGKSKVKRRGSKRGTDTMREVTPQMYNDSVARNMMATQKEEEKKGKRIMQGKELKKYLRSAQLYGNKKKKERKYSAKDLGVPELNSTVNPGAIEKRGKKGKKFVADGDNVMMNRLIKQINDDRDKVDESKLEKSKRLEEIRELRKQEMDRKEQKKKDELESVKEEIRSKASLARSARRKSAKARHRAEDAEEEDEEEEAAPKKKRVSFA